MKKCNGPECTNRVQARGLCNTHYWQWNTGRPLTAVTRKPLGYRDESGNKLCRRCDEWKPETGFHRNRSQADGLSNYCKTCYMGTLSVEARIFKASNRRRAKLNADEGCWFARESYTDLILRDPCVYCGSPEAGTLDHISPISVSLDDSWANLAPACKSCNSRKTYLDLLSYLERQVI